MVVVVVVGAVVGGVGGGGGGDRPYRSFKRYCTIYSMFEFYALLIISHR